MPASAVAGLAQEIRAMESMGNSPKMNDASNGVYFIAGGTGGIGSEVARRLVGHGAEVVLAARNESRPV